MILFLSIVWQLFTIIIIKKKTIRDISYIVDTIVFQTIFISPSAEISVE